MIAVEGRVVFVFVIESWPRSRVCDSSGGSSRGLVVVFVIIVVVIIVVG